MSIWLQSFYDMSILKWIALKAIWYKTNDNCRDVLSHWCNCLQWNGNFFLPHFDLQIKPPSLSQSQSLILDSLTMSIFMWIKKILSRSCEAWKVSENNSLFCYVNFCGSLGYTDKIFLFQSTSELRGTHNITKINIIMEKCVLLLLLLVSQVAWGYSPGLDYEIRRTRNCWWQTL